MKLSMQCQKYNLNKKKKVTAMHAPSKFWPALGPYLDLHSDKKYIPVQIFIGFKQAGF